jgi:hypothetical protein
MRKIKVYDTYIKMLDLDAIVAITLEARPEGGKDYWYIVLHLSGINDPLYISDYNTFEEARVAADNLTQLMINPAWSTICEWDPFCDIKVEDNE